MVGVVNWQPLIGRRENKVNLNVILLRKLSPRLLSRTPHFISTPSAPPCDLIYESRQFEFCCLPDSSMSPLRCEELAIGIGQSDTRATRTSSNWTARLACEQACRSPHNLPHHAHLPLSAGSDCRANLCSDPQAQGNEMQEVCSIAQG
jgi:hypothetical protein